MLSCAASAALAQSGQAKPADKSKSTAPAAPAGSAQAPSAWVVNCSDRVQGKLTCEMNQSIVEQQSRRVLMAISVKGVSEGTSNAMLIRTFHGVYLPAGLVVRVDGGTSLPIAYQKSDAAGVYAALSLNEKLVGEFKKGAEMVLRLEINKGEQLEIKAPLNGFAAAYDKVSSIR
jgi:invasion protein IalB